MLCHGTPEGHSRYLGTVLCMNVPSGLALNSFTSHRAFNHLLGRLPDQRAILRYGTVGSDLPESRFQSGVLGYQIRNTFH